MPCNILPVAVFVTKLFEAVDPGDSANLAKLVDVLARFTRWTGDKFTQDPHHTSAHTPAGFERCTRHFPYALRLAMRGFLCAVLGGLHGPLFDWSKDNTRPSKNSALAIQVRGVVDRFLDIATYDTRTESALYVDPPHQCGAGAAKVWAMLSLFPSNMKLTNFSLYPEDSTDPVQITSPIVWRADKVAEFQVFVNTFLAPDYVTGKARRSANSGLFDLTDAQLDAYFTPNVARLLRSKNAFRMAKVAPPCPKGRVEMLDPTLKLLYQTYPGGRKKTGPVVNPFGTAKGYHLKRHDHAARSRSKRHATKKAVSTPPENAPQIGARPLNELMPAAEAQVRHAKTRYLQLKEQARRAKQTYRRLRNIVTRTKTKSKPISAASPTSASQASSKKKKRGVPTRVTPKVPAGAAPAFQSVLARLCEMRESNASVASTASVPPAAPPPIVTTITAAPPPVVATLATAQVA